MLVTTPTLASLRRRRMLGASALALLGTPTIAMAAPEREGWQDVTLHQALQRDLVSAITGQHYRIFVSIPAGPAPAGGHPVLFALDGNASFATLALMARITGRRSGASAHTPPLVVGIGYVGDQDYYLARGRDYTPPSAEAGDKTARTGGADLFLDFIERELRPLVASLAPLDPARQALYGHSFGGLCTLHALFTRPAMFQTYLAASPSIWYGDRVLLKTLTGFAQRVASLPVKPSLMLSVGELEQPTPGPTPPQGRDAIAAERRMVGEAQDLARRLQEQGALARLQFHLLANENHGSATFPAMARGLEFFPA